MVYKLPISKEQIYYEANEAEALGTLTCQGPF